MKYTISYEYDAKSEPRFFAKATVSDGTIYRGGATWLEARTRMIETLKECQVSHEVPKPEEIEIP